MNDDKAEGVLLGVIGAIILGGAIAISWSVTRDNMRGEAVAAGAAHWVLQGKSVEFVWGPEN